jgi:hypothetical protein
MKPIRLWLPSQKGLLAEWPQRHREITVRPPNPNTWPEASQISNSPSIRNGPLLRGVILVGIVRIVACLQGFAAVTGNHLSRELPAGRLWATASAAQPAPAAEIHWLLPNG